MAEAELKELLAIWVEGWASSRHYPTQTIGGFPAAQLLDRSGDWVAFATDPTDDDFARLAEFTAASRDRILTILTDDHLRYRTLADQHGLAVLGADQELMVMDFEGKDVEEPWLNDDELKLKTDIEERAATVTVVTHDGDLAASGHVAVADGFAVFDRIVTEPDFRRRGLGSFVMRALTAAVSEHGADQGLLIASIDGQHLYHHLGWGDVSGVLMLKNPTNPDGPSLND
ncbi:GNAT family N-acetyltransferase [Sinomonas sp. JGH33]|uniref:GNAT family N-acetyltransferase n=1 Tax=Sinomonas terricola TaxID=3110330 RepID=A0ABU5T2A6_9MICC|nr:GNAT family N-acetyltransferase [Sinomonas sp. JGH33]MEA5453793.1 GNAT family N-acetyltransferase [Sinomonas sp. JGH33]